jgi:putative (di)nucleoside polyphosphate hydrolase
VIDVDGFRLNVGIILANQEGKLFWGRRSGMPFWQFPQGGIKAKETAQSAMYRELSEEIGLTEEDVALMRRTKGWLRYRLPKRYIRTYSKPVCIGQKQKWFLLRLLTDDSRLSLSHSAIPEFEEWRWVDYWYPLDHVVDFKRNVYKRVLEEFHPYVKDSAAYSTRGQRYQ